jgi:hypothetical protein
MYFEIHSIVQFFQIVFCSCYILVNCYYSAFCIHLNSFGLNTRLALYIVDPFICVVFYFMLDVIVLIYISVFIGSN